MSLLSPTWASQAQVFRRAHLKFEMLSARDHKGTRGRVCVIGGSAADGGAPRLASESALRFSAGYALWVEPPRSKVSATGLARIASEAQVRRAPSSVFAWTELLEAQDAIVWGCGMPAGGIPRRDIAAWNPFWKAWKKHLLSTRILCVVDGGGLSTFVSQWKSQKWKSPRGTFAFTPHPKEASDMLKALGKSVPKNRAQLFRAVQESLVELKITGALLLKGANPLVAPLDKEATPMCWKIATPVLGTAGSGDVLAGAVAGASLRIKGSQCAVGSIVCALVAQGRAAQHLPVGALAHEIGQAMAEEFSPHVFRRKRS